MKRKAPRSRKRREGHSRREREVMDALFKLGTATAAQIRDQIADPPSDTAIRTHLTILEQKECVRHMSDGVRYVYEPKVPHREMGADGGGEDILRKFDQGSRARACGCR